MPSQYLARNADISQYLIRRWHGASYDIIYFQYVTRYSAIGTAPAEYPASAAHRLPQIGETAMIAHPTRFAHMLIALAGAFLISTGFIAAATGPALVTPAAIHGIVA
jgi:hypothetical protein